MKTKIKTFEDACEALNIKPVIPSVELLEEKDGKAVIAQHKLSVIAKALNEGWKPNWSDRNQAKYYPWFKLSASGVGFSSYGYDCDYSFSVVGSRLCFKSSDLAEYAGEQFEELYNDLFTL